MEICAIWHAFALAVENTSENAPVLVQVVQALPFISSELTDRPISILEIVSWVASVHSPV